MEEKPKTKILIVTADFKPGTDTIQDHYGRIVNGVLNGEIKPGTSSVECYCNTCKKVLPGLWFDHQKTVHGRILPAQSPGSYEPVDEHKQFMEYLYNQGEPGVDTTFEEWKRMGRPR